MKPSVYPILLLALAGPVSAQAQAPAAPRHWTVAQCLKLQNPTAVEVSPDGRKVAYAVRAAVMTNDRSEYVNQIFVADADGRNAVQLTKSTKNSSAPRWSPDGRQLAFTSNRDDKTNLYVLNVAGGEAEQITQLKVNVADYRWRPDGRALAYTAPDLPPEQEEKNKKSKEDWSFLNEAPRQNRLYVVELAAKDSAGRYASRQLTPDTYSVGTLDWAPDGGSLVYSHARTAGANDALYSSDISVVDVAGAGTRSLAATGAGESQPHYSPDGRWVAYVATENPVVWGGRKTVQVVAAGGGEPRALPETPNADATLLGWAVDGRAVYVGENDRTLYRLYRLPTDGRQAATAWNAGAPQLLSLPALNATGTHWGFVLQTSDSPPQAYSSASKKYAPRRLTSLNAAMAGRPLPRTEVIRWQAPDGGQVEGLLTYPIGYQAGQRVPLILNVHGGPAGVFSQTFIGSNSGAYPLATWAEMGYAVLRANPRGSTGYGPTFRRANVRDWGGADYQELMAGVDEVVRRGVADTARLGVAGWSYGGFMSSWIVGHTRRFKAASIGAPVVDLVAQDGVSDIPGFLPSYYGKYSWEDPAVYAQHSPITFAGQVRTPVLLQHGEADVRVPYSQSVAFYNALRRVGTPVRLLTLPRQPHGPTEPKMVRIVQETNVEWMAKHLGGPAALSAK